ncbi:MAG: DUF3048 domain-containing protein [Acidimicrobiia bacterium]|nr:DUF3048 domain-containing protein [Acidimicrobiia bacterium]
MNRRSFPMLAVVAALGLLAAACSGSEAVEPTPTTAAETTTTVAPTTTTEPPPEYSWPLSGVAVDDPALTDFPAVVAKIDNSPSARPHVGLEQADVVYELLVEGITRFAAVFHSHSPDPVGPVRSARSSDIELLANLERPLLLWSGANPGVSEEVRRAQDNGLLQDVSHSVGWDHYWRQSGRSAPHNLFTSVPTIREHFTAEDARRPRDLFLYRDDDDPLLGVPAAGVVIEFGGGSANTVEYVWSAGEGCWLRYQGGPMTDGEGRQLCPTNVVVQHVDYDNSSGSPVARTTGSGTALLFTAGHVIEVQWDRPTLESATIYETTDGARPGLTPGPTWVGLPSRDAVATVMSPERAAELFDAAV